MTGVGSRPTKSSDRSSRLHVSLLARVRRIERTIGEAVEGIVGARGYPDFVDFVSAI